MKKYSITIEETIDEVFVVWAEDYGQALETAAKKYKSGEFVLNKNMVTFRQMAINKPNTGVIEWMEF